MGGAGGGVERSIAWSRKYPSMIRARIARAHMIMRYTSYVTSSYVICHIILRWYVRVLLGHICATCHRAYTYVTSSYTYITSYTYVTSSYTYITSSCTMIRARITRAHMIMHTSDDVTYDRRWYDVWSYAGTSNTHMIMHTSDDVTYDIRWCDVWSYAGTSNTHMIMHTSDDVTYDIRWCDIRHKMMWHMT